MSVQKTFNKNEYKSIFTFIYSTKKYKLPFETRLAHVLINSYYNPWKKGLNGAFWLDDYIAVNTKILGVTMNLEANSVNWNLRKLKLKRVQRIQRQMMQNFPDKNNWFIFSCDQCQLKKNVILKEYEECKKSKNGNTKDKQISSEEKDIDESTLSLFNQINEDDFSYNDSLFDIEYEEFL